MSDLLAIGYNSPKYMSVDGDAVFIIDKVSLAANPTNGDVLKFRIPAGLEIANVAIQCDDIDTNGSPTVVFGVGYAPIQSDTVYSPNATYFAAAGQTTMQAGGRLLCSFKPIKFEEDMALTITMATHSATFAAGDVIAIVGGNCVGVK